MNKKMKKQCLIILLIIILFIMFDVGFYNVITKRFINKYGKEMQEKSIKLEKYLPFEEKSSIVKYDSSFKLEENLPVLDGATALYPVYSAFMNATYPKENTVQYSGNNFLDGSKLQKSGTGKAYKAIVDGNADIIFCAKPSEKQLNYAKEKGVDLELVPIGKEAFVFLVNSKNIVNNLSVEEVKEIYKGNITNWNKVNGKNERIIPVQRGEGSGSQTSMISFMNNEEMKKVTNMFFGKCIGYSFRYYVSDVVADGNLKMLSLNGIYPNEENIRNGSYPIVDNFYAIYRKNDTNDNILKMIEWILSDEGQKIINETGYVGIK